MISLWFPVLFSIFIFSPLFQNLISVYFLRIPYFSLSISYESTVATIEFSFCDLKKQNKNKQFLETTDAI